MPAEKSADLLDTQRTAVWNATIGRPQVRALEKNGVGKKPSEGFVPTGPAAEPNHPAAQDIQSLSA